MSNSSEKGGQLIKRDITTQEEKLLNFFRDELQYGEARVVIKDGQPVFVRKAYRDVKLD